MKRSDINKTILQAIEFCREMRFLLPAFAYWTLDEWPDKIGMAEEIVDNQMGWDITDFGTGDFDRTGLLIFVLRNGNFTDQRYKKPYCEKILIQNEDQILPTHFHWRKMEDIINRGGGNLMVSLNNAVSDTEPDHKSPVAVTMDGERRSFGAGEPVRIRPGQSITLEPRQFHKFWAEPGTGRVLLGEVSTVADERVDNNFPEYDLRLPDVEEDERPVHLLFHDYQMVRDRASWPPAWRR
ncbi:MAG: D-lyxose/D-mannose family sugar isomerase [Spirochaetaceae bacterium]|nr:MAG: D-lyxose/D-mannose family sugar isomerase [Spirochaetaceae bacterium]